MIIFVVARSIGGFFLNFELVGAEAEGECDLVIAISF